MRYIANSDGYLREVSFGADITCGGTDCTEYTGAVPTGYTSLEDWYCQECEKLYRWKITSGELTLDASAAPPPEYSSFGTWTAAINGGTISAQYCTYMRIGNMCTISFEIEGTGANTATANQDVINNFLKIAGVPFAPSAEARWYGGGGHQQGLAIPTGYHFTGFILQRNTNDICARLTTAAVPSGQGYCCITNGAKAFYLSGTITYPIAE